MKRVLRNCGKPIGNFLRNEFGNAPSALSPADFGKLSPTKPRRGPK
jgi:hypothetical protein